MKIQNIPNLATLHSCYHGLNLANAAMNCFSESLPTKIFFESVIKPHSSYKETKKSLASHAVHTVSKTEVDFLTRKVSELVLTRCLIQWRVIGKNLKKRVPPLYRLLVLTNRLFYYFLKRSNLDRWIHSFVGKKVEKNLEALLRPLVDKMVRIVRKEIASRLIDKTVSMTLEWIWIEMLLQTTKGVFNYVNAEYLKNHGYPTISSSQVFCLTSALYGAHCVHKFMKARKQLMTRDQMKQFLAELLQKRQAEFYLQIQTKIKSFGFNATDKQINQIINLTRSVIIEALLFFFDVPEFSDC